MPRTIMPRRRVAGSGAVPAGATTAVIDFDGNTPVIWHWSRKWKPSTSWKLETLRVSNHDLVEILPNGDWIVQSRAAAGKPPSVADWQGAHNQARLKTLFGGGGGKASVQGTSPVAPGYVPVKPAAQEVQATEHASVVAQTMQAQSANVEVLNLRVEIGAGELWRVWLLRGGNWDLIQDNRGEMMPAVQPQVIDLRVELTGGELTRAWANDGADWVQVHPVAGSGRAKVRGTCCSKAIGSGQSSGDMLLDLEHRLSSWLSANPVPDNEKQPVPQSYESWVTGATDRAVARDGMFHALWAVKNIRGGPDYQGDVKRTLSNVLNHAYGLSRAVLVMDGRGKQFIDPHDGLRLLSAALAVATDWYPAALALAHEEGRAKGHAAGYVEGWNASVAERRTVLESVLDMFFSTVRELGDDAVQVAQAAANAAQEAARQGAKAAPWLAVAVAAVAAIVLGAKQKR